MKTLFLVWLDKYIFEMKKKKQYYYASHVCSLSEKFY